MNGKDSEAKQIALATNWLAEYDDLPVSQFGPLRLKAVREAMIKATGKHGKPLSRGYINDLIGRIVRMFRWGVENEIVEPSIHEALKAVSGLRIGRTTAPDHDPIEPVDDAILEATIAKCSPTVAAMIRIQQLTGMRPGEVCQLTPGMIDRSGDVWVAKFKKHKTAWKNKRRQVCFGPQAQKILLPFMLRPDDQPLFSPADSEKWRLEQRHAARVTKEGYGNCRSANAKRQAGSCYDTNSYRKAIWYAIAKAFPPPTDESELDMWKEKYRWSPNQIRHLTATEIRKRFGLEAAQVILGHSHADVTQLYAERIWKELSKSRASTDDDLVDSVQPFLRAAETHRKPGHPTGLIVFYARSAKTAHQDCAGRARRGQHDSGDLSFSRSFAAKPSFLRQ